MTREITESTARAIENELIAHHGLIVVPKAGALATFVGMAFDAARFIRPNLPTGQAFNQQFSTTIPLFPIEGLPGGVMLVPANEQISPRQRLERTAHEAKHVHQLRHPAPGYDAWHWGALYVAHSEFRAAQEAGGFLVNKALSWALDGQQIPTNAIVHTITNNYAIDDADRRMIGGLVDAEEFSIGLGIIRCSVSRLVLRRLLELQPDALTTAAQRVAEGISLQ